MLIDLGGEQFAQIYKDIFSGNEEIRNQRSSEFVTFSLLLFFATEQPDWRMKETKLVRPGYGSGSTFVPASGTDHDQCTKIMPEELEAKFTKPNTALDSLFEFPARPICLPPQTRLEVEPNKVTLTNPFCVISFNLKGFSEKLFFINGLSQVVAKMPNQESRFETWHRQLFVTVSFSGIRAQQKEMPKYKAWADRVFSGARNWFEGSSLWRLEIEKRIEMSKKPAEKSP